MAQRRLRSGNRLPGWLILAVAGTCVGLIALPFGDRANALVSDIEIQIEAPLAEFRSAIASYAQEHAEWPGALGEWQLRVQLLGTTDAMGQVGSGAEFMHGPYLAGELPLNPATGLGSVLIVDRMPESATDSGGWIYSHETGEVRPDNSGMGSDAQLLFDL